MRTSQRTQIRKIGKGDEARSGAPAAPSKKFSLRCVLCGADIGGFRRWFGADQRCPDCGSDRADVVYHATPKRIQPLFDELSPVLSGMWRYFDVLPVNDRAHIITAGEGIVPIDRWEFLEEYARKRFKVHCRVYAHRQDDNYATGTFKDLSGSLVASVLKENGIRSYAASSTGNTAVAYARYLTAAGISFYAFIPENASITQAAEVGCFGQKVFRVKGDYTRTKEMALAFSRKHKIPLAGGNFDPMRIEAKKTMMLEWLRLLDDFPTVYIQALSGGTGPMAIAKGCRDLASLKLFAKMPRFILTQSDRCAPMAAAWKDAKIKGFPEGWEKTYPVYHNPDTLIATLAAGFPKTYPVLGPLVRTSGGEILSFDERATPLIARLVAFERSVRIGPAAAIAVGGFFEALKQGALRNGDVVMVNIGEGIRRAPEFLEKLIQATSKVESVEDCRLSNRATYAASLWTELEKSIISRKRPSSPVRRKL
jgi:threonine synthase